jgi:putative transposase
MSDNPSSTPPMPPEVRKVNWPHAPPHRLSKSGSYFITAATYQKQRFFHDAQRRDLLHDSLLTHATASGWQLEAWAVFSNHYHFVARPALENLAKEDLGIMLSGLHEETAKALNALDSAPGRKVWHNFWDTHLTFERSLMVRLNYTIQNPVKHGLVKVASQYPWCSAAWFERVSTGAWVQTIYRFKTDNLKIPDDFDP